LIDKALMVIIFMYAVGFSIVGVQYTLADVFGITLTNVEGVPIDSALRGFIKQDIINQQTENIVTANFTTNSTFFDRVETFTTGAAYVAWELITLMTGTYIFYIMLAFGVDEIFVGIFVILYVLLLARAILGYVRGI